MINGSSSDTEFNSAPLLESMQNAFSDIFNTIFGRLTTDETNINILSNSLGRTNTTLNTINTSVEALSGRVNTNEKSISTLSGILVDTNLRLSAIGGGGGATYYVTNPLTFSPEFTRVGNNVSLTP